MHWEMRFQQIKLCIRVRQICHETTNNNHHLTTYQYIIINHIREYTQMHAQWKPSSRKFPLLEMQLKCRFSIFNFLFYTAFSHFLKWFATKSHWPREAHTIICRCVLALAWNFVWSKLFLINPTGNCRIMHLGLFFWIVESVYLCANVHELQFVKIIEKFERKIQLTFTTFRCEFESTKTKLSYLHQMRRSELWFIIIHHLHCCWYTNINVIN